MKRGREAERLSGKSVHARGTERPEVLRRKCAPGFEGQSRDLITEHRGRSRRHVRSSRVQYPNLGCPALRAGRMSMLQPHPSVLRRPGLRQQALGEGEKEQGGYAGVRQAESGTGGERQNQAEGGRTQG